MYRIYCPALLLAVACASPPADEGPPDAGREVDAGAPPERPAFDAAIEARLGASAAQAVAAIGIPGATWAAIAPDGSLARGAAGLADPSRDVPLAPGDRLRIGSITKTIVATVVLQLVEEGRLALDDTAGELVAGVPNGDRVTVRQLLSHTSGLADYVGAPTIRANLSSPHTPEELLAASARLGIAFEPGAGWGYSNTNYVVLGLVIEAVTGRSWAAEVRARITAPLGLRDTFVEGLEEGSHVAGFGWTGRRWEDATGTIDPSNAWAAGAMVSTAADLAIFLEALFAGRLLRPESLALMRTRASVGAGQANYGLGLVISDLNVGLIEGHSGAINGFESALYRLDRSGWILATLTNASGNGSADAVQKAIAEAAIGLEIGPP